MREPKSFRDYSGPSGPQYITADELSTLIGEISSELVSLLYLEGDDGEKDADSMRGQISAMIANKKRTELDVREFLASRLDRQADPVIFSQMADVINGLATDSKQLNSQEWCQKTEQISSRSSTGDFSLGGVFEGFGLDIGDKSSRARKISEKTSDCGKAKFENNFSFRFDGTRYIPKSIWVHSKLNASDSQRDRLADQVIRVSTSNYVHEVDVTWVY